MGYYTNYDLSIHADAHESIGVSTSGEAQKRVIEYIRSLVDEDDYLKQFLSVDVNNFEFNGFNGKWYDHEKDMVLLSLQFPEVVFCLSGKGEEEDDYWKKYFRAGTIQRCPAEVQIKYPEFDVSKMEAFKENKS